MTDIFRKFKTEIDEETQKLVDEIKESFYSLYWKLEPYANGAKATPERKRCITQAKRKLEEACMWACKGITSTDVEGNRE